MSFDSDFLTLMPSTLVERQLASFDVYGDPTYSTAETRYRCLVELKPTRVLNQQGVEIMATHVAYVASTGLMSATSEYTLPDGSTPEVQNIHTFYDEDGIHHSVMYFGGSN